MLDWVNPIRAVKSNFNAIIGAFLSWAGVSAGNLFANGKTGTLWLIPLELLLATRFCGLASISPGAGHKLWARL